MTHNHTHTRTQRHEEIRRPVGSPFGTGARAWGQTLDVGEKTEKLECPLNCRGVDCGTINRNIHTVSPDSDGGFSLRGFSLVVVRDFSEQKGGGSGKMAPSTRCLSYTKSVLLVVVDGFEVEDYDQTERQR